MNEQTMFRWLLAFVASVVLSLICVAVFGDLGAQFLFGWLTFPIAVLPRITVDWPSMIAGTIAFMTFAFGVQYTGRWAASWLPENLIASRTWQLRQTGLVVISVTLLFSLGTALVGAFHQVIWLSASRSAPSLDVSIDSPPRGLIASARQSAQQSELRNQMRQNFGIGMHNFHGSFKNFPPSGNMNTDGELLHGWMMALGWYIGFGARELDYGIPWNKPPNDRFYRCQLPLFLNPMQPGAVFGRDGFGLTHFAANVHVFPIRQVDPKAEDYRHSYLRHKGGFSMHDISDGTSNTLLIGTAGRNHKPWGYPANVRDPAEGLNRTSTGFGGPPGQRSAHFVMADGAVREISDKADPRILRALATPNGGEPLVPD